METKYTSGFGCILSSPPRMGMSICVSRLLVQQTIAGGTTGVLDKGKTSESLRIGRKRNARPAGEPKTAPYYRLLEKRR